MQRVIFGLISIFLLSIMFSCSGAAMGRNKDFRQPPALYNMNHLNELREKGAEDTEVKLLSTARIYIHTLRRFPMTIIISLIQESCR